MADISQRIERMVAVLDENKTALDAARFMSECFIGSVVITGSATVKGIFTERDLMKCGLPPNSWTPAQATFMIASNSAGER